MITAGVRTRVHSPAVEVCSSVKSGLDRRSIVLRGGDPGGVTVRKITSSPIEPLITLSAGIKRVAIAGGITSAPRSRLPQRRVVMPPLRRRSLPSDRVGHRAARDAVRRRPLRASLAEPSELHQWALFTKSTLIAVRAAPASGSLLVPGTARSLRRHGLGDGVMAELEDLELQLAGVGVRVRCRVVRTTRFVGDDSARPVRRPADLERGPASRFPACRS